MKSKIKMKNSIILTTVFFIILLSFKSIFKLKNNFITLLLVCIFNSILIPNWIKSNNIKINYKICLVTYIFILSSVTLFYFYEFEKNKFYVFWYIIITTFSILINNIYKFIKKS